MMADVLRSRIPETVDQVWDRWMSTICQLDGTAWNAAREVCESVYYGGILN